jgi:hypothetical protein
VTPRRDPTRRFFVKKKSRIDNAAPMLRAKIGVRKAVLENLGAEAHVFDAFAGSGELWADVWRDAKSYVGCDVRFFADERECFVADNRRILRAVDLGRFTIFDFDAYGSPWEQVIILCARRRLAPGERLGVILTEGSILKLKMGTLPHALRLIAGIRGNPAGLARGDGVLDAAVAGMARRLNAVIVRQWRAWGASGARMRYVGLVLEGKTSGDV